MLSKEGKNLRFFSSLRHKKATCFYQLRSQFFHGLLHILLHFRLLLRWCFFSVIIGLMLGVVGAAFVYCIQLGTQWRTGHPFMYLLLPVGGVLIVFLYRITHNGKDKGTNMVLSSLRSEAELPAQMAPLIFISTVITHTCGGSAGREGAALQLGGSLANLLGHGFRLREKDRRILILAGMSAAFSAIFRTPIAAPVFAMEVGCVGVMQYAALVPCVVASLTASYVAGNLGLSLSHYEVQSIPELTPLNALLILLLGICCATLSVLFCVVLHRTEGCMKRILPNPYLRIIAAGILLILLGLLFGTQDFYGIGSESITMAIGGSTVWYAFLAKMLFTAVTLGGGFKGGEIVPTFFIGASFGCLFGQLTGLSPSLCAAIGMVALFCGVTNCPLSALFIGAELFGMECVPFCLLAIAVSYLLSGYYGLYREQRFYISKFSDGTVSHKTRQ